MTPRFRLTHSAYFSLVTLTYCLKLSELSPCNLTLNSDILFLRVELCIFRTWLGKCGRGHFSVLWRTLRTLFLIAKAD